MSEKERERDDLFREVTEEIVKIVHYEVVEPTDGLAEAVYEPVKKLLEQRFGLWEEEPIDDERGPGQFEIGDRVRVYAGVEPVMGKITKICPLIYIEDETGKRSGGFHWRQCRKLKNRN